MIETLDQLKEISELKQKILLAIPNKKNLYEMQKSYILNELELTLVKIKN